MSNPERKNRSENTRKKLTTIRKFSNFPTSMCKMMVIIFKITEIIIIIIIIIVLTIINITSLTAIRGAD